MTYAFRCPKTGCVEFCDSAGRQHCPLCGKSHVAYQCGAPEPEAGTPAIIGDKLAKHMDWAAGCEINSKSQRKRLYKEKGLRLKSYAEHYRHNPKPTSPTLAISFPGQKNHTSTAEKHQLR